MRPQIRLVALFLMVGSCYSTQENITACVENDVNIPWVYNDSAGMNSVSWEHINDSNVKTIILVQAAGSNATVIGGYNIQHNTNGDVTITNATVANSGTYRITVRYSSATPTFTDDVVVNVYNPPTDLNFTESPLDSQTTFTCTAGSLGDPEAKLYIQVNGKDNTTSVSATVSVSESVKCFLLGPSVQCMSGMSGTVTSIYAQLAPTEASTTAPTTGEQPGTSKIAEIGEITGGSVGGSVVGGGGCYMCYRLWLFLTTGLLYYVIGTLFHGAIIGAVCVTKVPIGGPADGKLKVGDHIQRINGKPVLGKDQHEVKEMIEDKTKLNLLLLKGESKNTLFVELNHTEEEELGFKFQNQDDMMTVTHVSQTALKLEVGDQILKVNGVTVKGKKENEISEMINDKEKLTVDVSKVGSTDTSSVELKRHHLGFEYENLPMVTNITQGSEADGKLKIGHHILSINGKSTAGKSIGNVNKELKNHPKVLTLSRKRGEDTKDVTLDFKEKASPGISIKKEKEDIVVSAIEPESAAASGDVEVKDCILSINGMSTAGLKVADIQQRLTFSNFLKVTEDVTVLEIDPDLNGYIGVKNASANTVISVKAQGQAACAGIQEGDEILKIDGKSTDTMTVKQIAKIIESREKTVIFESERGEFTVERDTNGSLGLELSSTPNVVYKVDGNAALSRKVKPGDTIVSINGKKTKGKSHHEIRTMLKSSGDSISLKIKEAVTVNGNSHRTSGHGEQGTGTCVLEMDHLNSSTQDSGSSQD